MSQGHAHLDRRPAGVHYVDTTLRDGSHAIDQEFDPATTRLVVEGLVAAGVRYVEVGHGAGLGGSSILQGLARYDNLDLFDAASEVIGDAILVSLLVPGIGVLDDLREAVDHGLTGIRVAAHATEADVTLQHLQLARTLGLRAFGFLMMTHVSSPGALAEQARMMVDAGAEVVYLADSAGHMLPADVTSRIEAVRATTEQDVGFHGHNNLGLAMANSISAMDGGASWIDGSLGALGAGAGNTPAEVFAVVVRRLGTDVDLDERILMDLAEEVIRPVMKSPQIIDRASLLLGQAGLYSSFLRKSLTVGDRYGVDPRELLLEAGRRHAVGGQEDLLEQIAVEFTSNGGAHSSTPHQPAAIGRT